VFQFSNIGIQTSCRT